MIILTQHFQANTNPNIDFIIPLTAEQRNRSRQTIELSSLQKLSLRLPRGTVLEDGDLLQSDTQ
jgi:urease accessory protein